MKELTSNKEYKHFFSLVSQQIKSGQAKAAIAVNTAMILLYWDLGKLIADKQAENSWGNSVIEQLAKDLKIEFPGVSGFSRTNLFSIRQFYLFYASEKVQQAVGLLADRGNERSKVEQPVRQFRHELQKPEDDAHLQFVRQAIAQIPWGHHIVLITKVKEPDAAIFYIHQTIEHNWSRAALTLQIEQNLFARQGKAITNFKTTLPEQQARLAQQILKDPYNFSFLTLEPKVQELDLEKQLIDHISKFMLELGKGFAFIGRQYCFEVGQKEYAIDLLFYHIRLRCFVVIDLKMEEFKPEYTGKMNFYLSAIDDLLKTDLDQPTIGILLCKRKESLEVEYALRGISKPIGVSEFTFAGALPENLKSSIPTVEEFENELNKIAAI